MPVTRVSGPRYPEGHIVRILRICWSGNRKAEIWLSADTPRALVVEDALRRAMTATSGLVFTYNPEPGEPSMPLMIRGSVIDSVQAETCVVVAEAAPPEAADPTTPGAT